MSETPETAMRAADLIDSFGVNVHMEYTDGAYANEANVAADLAYLGIGNIRDGIPQLTTGGIPAQNELTSLQELAADGIKMDLGTGQATDISDELSVLDSLQTEYPGSIIAVEGPNEINNWPVTYDNLTGQAAATAFQDAVYSAVHGDTTLQGVAVYDFTGGTSPFPPTPYGTLIDNPDGSYTLVNGITGWPVTLPEGITTINISETNPYAGAGLFGYPGAAQQTGIYNPVNGQISFTYDNTSGAPLQTYVTVASWNQSATITAVSAVSGDSGNLVNFDPSFSLAGEADDANAHPYAYNGNYPGQNIAEAFLGPYGIMDPPKRVITEDGYNTDPNDSNGVSQNTQAIQDVDILLDGAANGDSITYLYELLDEKPDPDNSDPQMHYGLFNNDNSPKASAFAIHNLTSILADPGANATSFTTGSLDWSATGLPATANTLLTEKSNGAYDLALWNESNTPAGNVTISFGGIYNEVEVFDPISSQTALATLSNAGSISLSLGSDPLIIELEPNPDPACIAAGTRIRTENGERLVESLQIGDRIKTLHAGLQPIKWIGRRTYRAPFCNHAKILPIRITANALAAGVPSRDLFVSPGHAIAQGGMLIHASRLVNGRSITQLSEAAEITYFHIELATHEVIFAENTPAETFMGEVFRGQFHNAPDFAARYPGEAAPEVPCLPLADRGFQLAANPRARRAPGPLAGFIDSIDQKRITGWAADRAALDEPVILDILAGARRIARAIANIPRLDVAAAGFGAGHHGFECDIPGIAEGPITVRRAADGAMLATAEASARFEASKRSLF